jgi:hypothetical protein
MVLMPTPKGGSNTKSTISAKTFGCFNERNRENFAESADETGWSCKTPSKTDFLRKFAQIEAESTYWTPWSDGAYLHVGSEEVMFAARVTQVKVQTNLFLDSTGVTADAPHLATSRPISFKGVDLDKKMDTEFL